MGFWSIIGGVLGGPITTIASKWMDSDIAKARIGASVQIAGMSADIELNRLKTEMAKIHQGWWVTRYIVPGFAYPLIFWWGAIVLDSIFPHLFPGWNVAALPGPMHDWAGQIILSFFIVRSVELFTNPLRSLATASLGQKIVNIVKGATGQKKGVRRGNKK